MFCSPGSRYGLKLARLQAYPVGKDTVVDISKKQVVVMLSPIQTHISNQLLLPDFLLGEDWKLNIRYEKTVRVVLGVQEQDDAGAGELVGILVVQADVDVALEVVDAVPVELQSSSNESSFVSDWIRFFDTQSVYGQVCARLQLLPAQLRTSIHQSNAKNLEKCKNAFKPELGKKCQ